MLASMEKNGLFILSICLSYFLLFRALKFCRIELANGLQLTFSAFRHKGLGSRYFEGAHE